MHDTSRVGFKPQTPNAEQIHFQSQSGGSERGRPGGMVIRQAVTGTDSLSHPKGSFLPSLGIRFGPGLVKLVYLGQIQLTLIHQEVQCTRVGIPRNGDKGRGQFVCVCV